MYVHVCVYELVYVVIHAHVVFCVEVKATYPPHSLLVFFFEIRSFNELKITSSSQLAGQQGPVILFLPAQTELSHSSQ